MDEVETTASRRHFLGLAALVATGAAVVGQLESAGATPATGTVAREELAKGRINDQVAVSTKGPSDFYVQHVTLDPGAASGWHTHPGAELAVVKAGVVTFMDSEDCQPRSYQAGQGFFVPPGTTHVARNEGSVPAELYVTFLVAAEVPPRTDADQPKNCRS